MPPPYCLDALTANEVSGDEIDAPDIAADRPEGPMTIPPVTLTWQQFLPLR
jgi:hypothetical protein